jgi:DNA-binding XRE family transcriptional regulator
MMSKKMTQTEFAESLGVHRTHLSAIVAGKSLPSLDLAFALAAALGRPIPDLWERTEVGIRARAAQTRRR